jgi:glycosyltransferase involved in cell wall biosynthesis
MMKRSVLAIIPAYNEEASIANTVMPFLEESCPYDYLVVNDGSSDHTMEICKANGFRVLDLKINVGLSYAVKAGMRYAFEQGYEYAVQFDGDGQHDIRYIDLLFKPVSEHLCDIAVGSRFLKKRAKLSMRTLGGKIISLAVFLSCGQMLTDPTSGMRLYNREMIELYTKYSNINPEPDTLGYLIRSGIRVLEVPVEMRERTEGESKFSFFSSITYMIKTVCSLVFIQWFRKKESILWR